jgi:hypothetical protein
VRIELALIPVILALAAAALTFMKPLDVRSTDLSALFLYWPEAYAYAERGDPAAVYRITGLVVCANANASDAIDAPPGIAFKALNIYCRFRP